MTTMPRSTSAAAATPARKPVINDASPVREEALLAAIEAEGRAVLFAKILVTVVMN
jgi:hypothetical protein